MCLTSLARSPTTNWTLTICLPICNTLASPDCTAWSLPYRTNLSKLSYVNSHHCPLVAVRIAIVRSRKHRYRLRSIPVQPIVAFVPFLEHLMSTNDRLKLIFPQKLVCQLCSKIYRTLSTLIKGYFAFHFSCWRRRRVRPYEVAIRAAQRNLNTTLNFLDFIHLNAFNQHLLSWSCLWYHHAHKNIFYWQYTPKEESQMRPWTFQTLPDHIFHCTLA